MMAGLELLKFELLKLFYSMSNKIVKLPTKKSVLQNKCHFVNET